MMSGIIIIVLYLSFMIEVMSATLKKPLKNFCHDKLDLWSWMTHSNIIENVAMRTILGFHLAKKDMLMIFIPGYRICIFKGVFPKHCMGCEFKSHRRQKKFVYTYMHNTVL